jgi:tetratricopeptide (TPR) repeat protein
MTTSTQIPGSKVGRARRRLSQLWQVPVFLAGLFAFLSVAASAPWRHPPQWWEFDGLLVQLRAGLEQNEDPEKLADQAEVIDRRLPRFADRAAEAHFLIGSAYYRQAKQKPTVVAEEIWPRAAENLEQAKTLKDADRLAQQYRLGYCLYQQKKDVPRAIEMMTLAVDKGAEQPLEGYRLLVEANLARTPANLDAALSAMQRVLDLTKESDVEAMAQARVQHGELLLRKGLRVEAFNHLERAIPKAPRGLRVKARLLQTKCCEEDGLWQKAIAIWQELVADAALVDGGRARISYQMGWCYHQMEPPNHAETMRVWSEALKLGGPEGQAAGLRLGELRLSMGDKNAALALADWKQALAKVNQPKDFKNQYIQLAEVCELFEQAIKYFEEKQDPQKTQEVADLYGKLAPGGVLDKLRAKNAEELAEHKKYQHTQTPDAVTLKDVELQFRRAGELHELAAKVLPEAERAEALWRSVTCYLSAKEDSLALKTMAEHEKFEKDENRLAENWFDRGDIYRGQGQKDSARQAFLKCLQYPNTKWAYRAKFFLALDEIDKKNYKGAHDILHDILVTKDAPVDPATQEKSQYKIAWLLMQMGQYEQAHIELKACQVRYPENPNVFLAREQLGECCRRLARKEQQIEKEILDQIKPGISDEQRIDLTENARQHHLARVRWLNDAIRAYHELADELEKMAARSKTPPTPLEDVLLRRARFGIGECHLDNEEFFEAKNAFWTLQTKNRRTLESFYASLRICNMVDVMRDMPKLPKASLDEARQKALESLRLLGDDLKSLPDDHETFRRPGVPTREEWQRWLNATQIRLLAPPKKETPPVFR